jgi:hypothetical protein
MVYFWNFPFNIFELGLPQVTDTVEGVTVDKEDHYISIP